MLSLFTFFKCLAETDLFSMRTPRRQLVGLDIGSSGIKLVQLKEREGGTSFRRLV